MNADAQLIEHMMNPQNYGDMPENDATGMGKNPQNGEKVAIYLKVEKADNPIIKDISFQAIGCSTTIVSGSIITSEAKGITFTRAEELVSVTLGMLDNLPPEDAACTEMVALALKAALDTYIEKQKDSDFPMISYQISTDCTPKEEENSEKTI
ncbi:iron-sulfur cluster assembly scaffold protein [Sulfurovum sp. bin170]|uniref:iron-sulfur cluster assembly scaffold protein n=1 Tax=Sulfurovum sp. bin170 TaxID=2695268 RepID=UPI0013DE9B59|nr:iron-sulfur cluster assembly scaffold protein [Sulfurovum sp. bin170]NEW60348.1 iron-sulfur cluster assembly scaffold protein [Sulfurovum sp. bin170]